MPDNGIEMPVLVVKPTDRGEPPLLWCLPSWSPLVRHWDKAYGKIFPPTACKQTPECDVPPDKLRAQVESWLRAFPAWGAQRKLLLDTYTVARNIQSEFGAGGSPEERAAIGLAAVNRARAAGDPDVTSHLIHGRTGTYGKQTGSIRPASTAQEPSLANILLADLIVSGQIRDFTNGATHYFDRVTQDYMHAKKPENNPSGEDVYLDWTGGGDFLTWLGHMPGIRPWKLALLKRRPDLKPRADDTDEVKRAKIAARAKIRSAGQDAIMGTARAPAPWDSCLDAISALARRTAGLGCDAAGCMIGDPELEALQDRDGALTALYCVFLAGVSGVAAGLAFAPRTPRRRRRRG